MVESSARQAATVFRDYLDGQPTTVPEEPEDLARVVRSNGGVPDDARARFMLEQSQVVVERAEQLILEARAIRNRAQSAAQDKDDPGDKFEEAYGNAVVRNLDELQLFGANLDRASKRQKPSDKERRVDLAGYPFVSLGQKTRLVSSLAFWMLRNGLEDRVDGGTGRGHQHAPGAARAAAVGRCRTTAGGGEWALERSVAHRSNRGLTANDLTPAACKAAQQDSTQQ